MILVLLRHRTIQVLTLLTLYFAFAGLLPLAAHQSLYTTSVFIKDLLVWLMPLTVGLFIAHAISSFERRAPLFIGAIILFEALSNFTSVWTAYAGGQLASDFLPSLQLPESQEDFRALFRLPLSKPAWWSADKGSIAGLIVGCIAAFSKNQRIRRAVVRGKEIAQWILTRIFSRLIPLFVLGFVARMHETHLLHHVFVHYASLLLWLAGLLSFYIVILFLLGSGRLGALKAMKNLSPAATVAFTSGCSLSTMPWTIEGTAKNLDNPQLAKAVIPATTNIQQIGDCLTNTFLCFLLYKHFFGVAPDLSTWLLFSGVFVLARFATAAVLGGAIFIMLPIYEHYLSFNAEMIAIILAFNVILDPLITCTNVVANGALCRVFERVWNQFSIGEKEISSSL